ncbi:MAG: TolB protein [Thermoleophilaceae bacterium]|jgi:dipeptidyl aminopeptidase/acylaminoacyl peptidase|nr:TolB protein [Thermoleophilaceae bacterium]
MVVRRAVSVLGVALTWLLLGEAAQGSVASSSAGRQPSVIAYGALTGGIFTIRPDGRGNREILPGSYRPVWSPDGARLLYDGGDGALWSARADGTAARPVVRPQDIRSGFPAAVFSTSDGTWSPSGKRVAFVAFSEDENEHSVYAICTARIDGSGLRKLRRGLDPEWFPDGRRIAFTDSRTRASRSNQIAVMRPNGRDRRVLLGDTRGFRHDLAVSPNGRKLAFIESSSLPGITLPFLRVMDLRTRRTRTIPVSKIGPVHAIAWTPGGTRIASLITQPALGQRVPPSSVYTIRPDGTGRKRLFTLPFEERRGLWGEALSWQPR